MSAAPSPAPAVATIAATKAAMGEKDAAKQKAAADAIKITVKVEGAPGAQAPWTARYPAKAKQVLWTFVHSSAKLVLIASSSVICCHCYFRTSLSTLTSSTSCHSRSR